MGDDGDVVRHALEVPEHATIDDALAALGHRLPAAMRARIDDADLAVAVYGKLRPREAVLQEGDRIELVAGLVVDPKVARRRRVQQRRDEGVDPRWKRR